MAHYLFNVLPRGAAKAPARREQAVALLRIGMWPVDGNERHADALAAGDVVLIYLGAPEREFVGRAELASVVRDWTPSEAQAYPGDSSTGVLLAHVEEWNPPVPMSAVLAEIGPSETAKADFDAAVVGITAYEYEAALAVAARRGSAAS